MTKKVLRTAAPATTTVEARASWQTLLRTEQNEPGSAAGGGTGSGKRHELRMKLRSRPEKAVVVTAYFRCSNGNQGIDLALP